MSETAEVAIIFGRPDYDFPVDDAVMEAEGMSAVGRDGLAYLWRFEEGRASLWAITDGREGASLGTIDLVRPASGDAAARVAVLRETQASMRAVQTACITLTETLLSLAGPAPPAALSERLHRLREGLGRRLLMFTDPADDSAHGEFRLMPEVVGIKGAPVGADRERLRPLAVVLLKQHAKLLGIEDPDGLLALV